jgi:ArsR family transcriptional regulator
MLTDPWSGLSRPEIMERVVVFPAPLGPRNPRTSPLDILKETPSTATTGPNRLEIFMKLVSCCTPGTVCSVDSEGGAFVGDLSKDLDIVPSTVSHHIKELRQAGLIKMKRKGQKIECYIEPEVLENLSNFFSNE